MGSAGNGRRARYDLAINAQQIPARSRCIQVTTKVRRLSCREFICRFRPDQYPITLDERQLRGEDSVGRPQYRPHLLPGRLPE
jgi:hypothetical protein